MNKADQSKQVCAFLRNIDARTKEDEDAIIMLFVGDPNYSADAIMEGVGMWRTELRSTATPTP